MSTWRWRHRHGCRVRTGGCSHPRLGCRTKLSVPRLRIRSSSVVASLWGFLCGNHILDLLIYGFHICDSMRGFGVLVVLGFGDLALAMVSVFVYGHWRWRMLNKQRKWCLGGRKCEESSSGRSVVGIAFPLTNGICSCSGGDVKIDAGGSKTESEFPSGLTPHLNRSHMLMGCPPKLLDGVDGCCYNKLDISLSAGVNNINFHQRCPPGDGDIDMAVEWGQEDAHILDWAAVPSCLFPDCASDPAQWLPACEVSSVEIIFWTCLFMDFTIVRCWFINIVSMLNSILLMNCLYYC